MALADLSLRLLQSDQCRLLDLEDQLDLRFLGFPADLADLPDLYFPADQPPPLRQLRQPDQQLLEGQPDLADLPGLEGRYYC